MRLRWFFLCALGAAAAACAVDPTLTCGSPCADAAASDSGADVTAVSEAGTDAGSDVVNDVTNDSSCKGDGGYCQSNSSCCSNACNEYGKCSPSCGSQSSGCSGQTCCIGLYCGGSSCVQCKQDNATCSQDYECCGGSCQSTADAGQRCTGN